MPRIPIAFAVGDISAFAKSLRKQLETRDGLPGHVELLNMLARSAGHRNFQDLRSTAPPAPALEPPIPAPASSPVPAETPDLALVERTLRHFGEDGRLVRWPSRRSQQVLCLWSLWASFPAERSLDDAAVKAFLAAHHAFGDHALLRRELVDLGLVTRSVDGRDYRRVERRPPAEALALIRRLRAEASP